MPSAPSSTPSTVREPPRRACPSLADDKVEYSYINLLRNSERYTGYKGEHAARVWGAIYSQDMFRGVNEDGAPPEQRVFYRQGWAQGSPGVVGQRVADQEMRCQVVCTSMGADTDIFCYACAAEQIEIDYSAFACLAPSVPVWSDARWHHPYLCPAPVQADQRHALLHHRPRGQ